MLEVEAGAYPYFEGTTFYASECFFSFDGHGAVIECDIEQSVEDDSFVPSHLCFVPVNFMIVAGK